MTNLREAKFTLTDMTTSRSLDDRLSTFANVKEFGAVGDGVANDTAAIQAAINHAYGPLSDPHFSDRWGEGPFHDADGDYFTNKIVFFPAGLYKIDETLSVPASQGISLVGAGSYNTRIFFDPEAEEHFPADEDGDPPVSSVLEFRMCWLSRIEGLTLDASGVQQTAFRAMNWTANYLHGNSSTLTGTFEPGEIVYQGASLGAATAQGTLFSYNLGSLLVHYDRGAWVQGALVTGATSGATIELYDAPWVVAPYGDDGSGGYYHDVHLTNGVLDGFMSFGVAMGSERTWINCRFTNSKWGHSVAQSNALNHCFYNCLFSGNEVALRQTQGGCFTIWACRFENNSLIDVAHKQNTLRLVGCHSTSKNFCQADGVITACTHTNASEGVFWSPAAFHGLDTEWLGTIPGDDPFYAGAFGTGGSFVSCKGNHSTNGIFYTNNDSGTLHLVGNDFENSSYLTDYLANGRNDGAVINP